MSLYVSARKAEMHRVSSAIAANMKKMIGKAVKRPILTAKKERMSAAEESPGYDQTKIIQLAKTGLLKC